MGTAQWPAMSVEAFAEYLSRLDEAALTRVLAARPDVRVEPVPRGFTQLAQRLGGADSLADALRGLDRDATVVGQAVAALGQEATLAAVARLLGAPEIAVREGVARLCDRGMAWTSGNEVCLPERLAEHWSAEIGGGRPTRKAATPVRVDDLRVAAEALGVGTAGLRKPELIAALAERMADVRAMVAAVRRLPRPARTRLDELRHGAYGSYYGYDPYGSYGRSRGGPEGMLAAAGLALSVNGRLEVPLEVAVAVWLAERELMLTGRPVLPAAEADATSTRPAARAAADEALRAVTTLLDDANASPVAALKKGGIGQRERRRLAARLSIAEDVLALWIDLAHAAGLLGRADAGYVPTGAYEQWRAAEPGVQWAALASAWFDLEHAPLSREVDGDREQPPPLPLLSGAGAMRRALLHAAGPGLSVRAAGAEIDWFFPLHGYDGQQRLAKVAAAVREAELLGVVAADRLTSLGEHLLAAGGDAAALATACAPLLPAAPCSVILQSDLTAVVAGRPSMPVAQLLAAAAVSEARGTAAVWRFTPASVRAALDAGWRADDLLAELKAASDSALPQPLEYLINDVARRHGHVRVRGMRCCLLADEATITELVHTRALAPLHLSRLAPTVAASPFEVDEVLARLRATGFAPVAEDALGAVIIEQRRENQAPGPVPRGAAPRPRLDAAELARRLADDPHGSRSPAGSDTFELLAGLNPHLDGTELELLADALEHHRDVLITYRSKTGSRTIRPIRPQQIYDRWLDSWCHLRDAQRDFTIANIESVSPA